jgi:dihydroneopterin aldolase
VGEPDRIELRGLRLTAVVGVLPEERERAQPLEVDLVIEADTTAAGLSDDLADTVDYGSVCDVVAATAKGAEPLLLERLAALLADAVLGLDGRIDAVELAVRKLRPPVAHVLDSSGVRIVRRQGA